MYYFDLESQPMLFRGYGEYVIQETPDSWLWRNTVTNQTLASYFKGDGENKYPIGTKTWMLNVGYERFHL